VISRTSAVADAVRRVEIRAEITSRTRRDRRAYVGTSLDRERGSDQFSE
jgi:hypothetical protein